MMGLVRIFLTHFTYVALIAILMASGLGVPVPEDFPLIFSGYMCHEDVRAIDRLANVIDSDDDAIADTPLPGRPVHVPNLYLMIFSGLIGVMAGDTIVFFVGRRGIDSENFVARHLRKVLHSKRRERVERHFHHHGNLTVFAGRFMPGFRSLVFAMAGMSRMTYLRFIIIDGFAAAISVPTFIVLGYRFARHIDEFVRVIERSKLIVGSILLVVAAVIGTLYLLRRRRIKAAALAPTDAG